MSSIQIVGIVLILTAYHESNILFAQNCCGYECFLGVLIMQKLAMLYRVCVQVF